MSCAAGLAALEVTLADDLPARAATLGLRATAALEKLMSVGWLTAVRGKGLLLGAELPTVDKARLVVKRARDAGLIVGCALHDERVLRLTPPLTLSVEEARLDLDLLAEALA